MLNKFQISLQIYSLNVDKELRYRSFLFKVNLLFAVRGKDLVGPIE